MLYCQKLHTDRHANKRETIYCEFDVLFMETQSKSDGQKIPTEVWHPKHPQGRAYLDAEQREHSKETK